GSRLIPRWKRLGWRCKSPWDILFSFPRLPHFDSFDGSAARAGRFWRNHRMRSIRRNKLDD
ncbi:MAG: hypothetical protein ACK54L_01635, partial [Betaproteobacteria bacterium]